jgi:hypothetical protein
MSGFAILSAAALALAGAVSFAVTRELHRLTERRPQSRDVRSEGGPLQQIEEIARTLEAAEHSELELDRSLRPLLASVAAVRLARRGVSLERDPQRAEALLGPELAALVRPDRPRASSRVAVGMRRDEIDAMVGRLEQL